MATNQVHFLVLLLILANFTIHSLSIKTQPYTARRLLDVRISTSTNNGINSDVLSYWKGKIGTNIPQDWQYLASRLSKTEVQDFKSFIEAKALISNKTLAALFCSSNNLMCNKLDNLSGLSEQKILESNFMMMMMLDMGPEMMPIDMMEMMMNMDMDMMMFMFMMMDVDDMMNMNMFGDINLMDMNMGMDMEMDLMGMNNADEVEMNIDNIMEMNNDNIMEMNNDNVMEMNNDNIMEMNNMDNMDIMEMNNMDIEMTSTDKTSFDTKLTPKDEAARSFWFRESDLVPSGGVYNIHEVPAWRFSTLKQSAFPKTFLPRILTQALGSIEEKNVPHFLDELHISKKSYMAKTMKTTAQLCQHHKISKAHGEFKGCITSLEDMADFFDLVSSKPSHAKTITPLPSASLETNDKIINNGAFKVVKVELKAGVGSKHGVCHPAVFPFLIAFCHSSPTDKLYAVTLESITKPGFTITNIAVCHTDTSKWSPRHVALRIFNSKPGAFSICHWSQPGQIIFVS